MNESVAAVVPVLDEEAAIGDVVRGLLASDACCVIVVDGGSRDETADVAAAAGAQVVREPRRGYGRACLTGAEMAQRPHRHDAIAFLDGDGSCDPADLRRLIGQRAGRDLILGRRRSRDVQAGAMPIQARIGNELVAGIISRRTTRRIRDLPPYKLISADLLERLRLDATGYGWTVQLIARAAADRHARIGEVPVRFLRRRGGESKVSGRLWPSVLAAIAMLRSAWAESAPRPIIALVAKAPRAGHVKTRLIPDVGARAACALWDASLIDTAGVLKAVATEARAIPMVIAPAAEIEEVGARVGPGWIPLAQHGTGLAAAIATAFVSATASGADRAIVVSGDNPDLPPAHLHEAIRILRSTDAVLGPTDDGGYHLVGLRWRRISPIPWLRGFLFRRHARRVWRAFEAVPMGSERALDATARALAAAGWRVGASPGWPDVDTATDLRHLAARLEGACADVAPSTRAWLRMHEPIGPLVHER